MIAPAAVTAIIGDSVEQNFNAAYDKAQEVNDLTATRQRLMRRKI